MTDLSKLSLNWQLRLGAYGETVSNEADIAQCLGVILTTPRGSVPLDPEFGVDCWQWIDAPIAEARRQIVRAAWQALEALEPRAKIHEISADAIADGRFRLTIDWEANFTALGLEGLANFASVSGARQQTGVVL